MMLPFSNTEEKKKEIRISLTHLTEKKHTGWWNMFFFQIV